MSNVVQFPIRKPTLAITGICGMIGRRVAERAIAKGWRVRGLDINKKYAGNLRQIGAKITIGSINDTDALERAFVNADYVLHAAGIVSEDHLEREYNRVHVDAVHNICNVAEQMHVRRLVHISSAMVYGFDFPPAVQEDGPKNAEDHPFNASKLQGETIALNHHDPHGLQVVALRPGAVYGKLSKPWLIRPLQLLKRRMFYLPHNVGDISHTHVDNLVDAIFSSFEADTDIGGHAFNITDGLATPVTDFFAYHAYMAQRRLRILPAGAVRSALRSLNPALKALRQPGIGDPSLMRFLQMQGTYSIQKARDMLDYRPRITLAEGMKAIHEELVQERRVARPKGEDDIEFKGWPPI